MKRLLDAEWVDCRVNSNVYHDTFIIKGNQFSRRKKNYRYNKKPYAKNKQTKNQQKKKTKQK